LRKIDDPDGIGRCDERRNRRVFNPVGGCQWRQLGERATGARAGEYAMIASGATVMVMSMRRVRQQLRREALGAEFQRERPSVRRHESGSNERACREHRQHQADGQTMGELWRLPGSHGCSEINTPLAGTTRRPAREMCQDPGIRSSPVWSALSTARVRSRTPNLPRMLDT
jgi:hypothetical protein